MVDTLANVKLLAQQAVGAGTLEQQIVGQLVPQTFNMACEDIKTEPEDLEEDYDELEDESNSTNDNDNLDMDQEDYENSNVFSVTGNSDSSSLSTAPPAKKMKLEKPSIRVFKVPSESKKFMPWI